MTREINPFSMAMGSWMANCCRVESDGIVRSWIYFNSAFGHSLENQVSTRDEEFLVFFNRSLRARAARILLSNENLLMSSGGMMAFAELMLG